MLFSLLVYIYITNFNESHLRVSSLPLFIDLINLSHNMDNLTNIPCTCTVMLTLLVVAVSPIEFLPVHIYSPSCAGYWDFTMWRADITLPGVTMIVKVPSCCLIAEVLGCVIISV